MSASTTFPLIDSRRDRRMGELIGILWLLSLADLFFTLWAHVFTPFYELNPIARTLLNHNLLLSLVLLKVVLTAIGSTIFWRLRNYARAEIVLWGVVLTYVLLTMRWSDYTLGVIRLSLPA
jgi:hypothetical protein